MDYLVKMNNICKNFPGVKALDNVNFDLKRGEVLALLGENGAGKSTLMKILSGVYTKDGGEVFVHGNRYDDLTPQRASELGISIIHQELNMCSHLTISENIFLGKEIKNSFVLSNKKMNQMTAQLLKRLNLDLDPNTLVGDLPVSKQQMIEIAKALSQNSKVLIMDEPTSALTLNEINDLFEIIRKLKSDGCGIIYISHRLDELQHIVDRVTIMRDGKFINSFDFEQSKINEIIANMVGREIKEKFPRVQCEKGKKVLEVRNLNAGKLVRDINFDVHEGEILGIAGLMGSGRTETTRAIFGVTEKESGEIYLDGKVVTIKNPDDAIEQGLVLVPEDRKKDGLCIKLSIRENITLPNLDIISNKVGVVNTKAESEMVTNTIKNINIKTHSPEINAENLSGGNQQKIVVGKWLARNSRVIIFDEPTRGIDVAAKVEIYNLINELKLKGIGVVIVSSEMPEVLGISDRIIVMCDGRISGSLDSEQATQEKIMEYATQFEKKVEVV